MTMTERAHHRGGLTGYAVFLFVIVPVASAVVAVVILHAVQGLDFAAADYIRDKGAPKVMRRVMMLMVLIMLPAFLRRAGWEGWRDIGWSRDPARHVDPHGVRDVGVGLAAGFATMAAVVVGSVWVGNRTWSPGDAGPLLVGVVGFLAAAALIAVVEETAVRGVLFRVLGRRWGAVRAMVVTSLLFSWLHFFRASPEAVDRAGGPVQEFLALVGTSWSGPLHTSAFLPRFANLTLMGMALCLVVMRRRTVWLAVGLHAAWVTLKRTNSEYFDRVPEAMNPGWFGLRSDGLDGWLTTVALLALIAGIALWRPAARPYAGGTP